MTYSIMGRVIQVFEMETLFNTKLPKLKLIFYQLDRLVSIYLPDLHLHFKEEQINSSLYSSSVFITIFTSHMQSQKDNQHSWKIARIWDHFLINGWKTIFKTCLLVLKTYEEELFNLNFEEMIALLINLPHRFLVKDCERVRNSYLN